MGIRAVDPTVGQYLPAPPLPSNPLPFPTDQTGFVPRFPDVAPDSIRFSPSFLPSFDKREPTTATARSIAPFSPLFQLTPDNFARARGQSRERATCVAAGRCAKPLSRSPLQRPREEERWREEDRPGIFEPKLMKNNLDSVQG